MSLQRGLTRQQRVVPSLGGQSPRVTGQAVGEDVPSASEDVTGGRIVSVEFLAGRRCDVGERQPAGGQVVVHANDDAGQRQPACREGVAGGRRRGGDKSPNGGFGEGGQ